MTSCKIALKMPWTFPETQKHCFWYNTVCSKWLNVLTRYCSLFTCFSWSPYEQITEGGIKKCGFERVDFSARCCGSSPRLAAKNMPISYLKLKSTDITNVHACSHQRGTDLRSWTWEHMDQITSSISCDSCVFKCLLASSRVAVSVDKSALQGMSALVILQVQQRVTRAKL